MSEALKYEKSEKFTAREKLAMNYADAIIWNPEQADDAMWKRLHAEFSEPQLVEIGYWIGFISGGQRWLKTLSTKAGELKAFLNEKRGVKA